MTAPLRIGFVPGVIPDKWARIWREREPGSSLELVALGEVDDPRAGIDTHELDMCFLRLPVDQAGLHLIPLYEEVPVVVVGTEHPAAAYDELSLADLAAEQLVLGVVPNWEEVRTATPLPFGPMTTKDAIEVVASGTGIAIVPLSIARLHHRKDVVHRPVSDVEATRVGLAWLVENEDPRLETFIGIVRGRRATSTRGAGAVPEKQKKLAARKAGPKKTDTAKSDSERSGQRKQQARRPAGKATARAKQKRRGRR